MQKIKLAGFALALALAAGCSKKSDVREPTPDPNATTTNTDVASPGGCATEIQIVCADGMVDGCSNGTTTDHACVAADAKAGPDCAQEIALECPAGQMDGCLTTPTKSTTHVCVATAP
jgi:hypothetical protein